MKEKDHIADWLSLCSTKHLHIFRLWLWSSVAHTRRSMYKSLNSSTSSQTFADNLKVVDQTRSCGCLIAEDQYLIHDEAEGLGKMMVGTRAYGERTSLNQIRYSVNLLIPASSSSHRINVELQSKIKLLGISEQWPRTIGICSN